MVMEVSKTTQKRFTIPKNVVANGILKAIESYLKENGVDYKGIRFAKPKEDVQILVEVYGEEAEEVIPVQEKIGDEVNPKPGDMLVLLPRNNSVEARKTIKQYGFLWKAPPFFRNNTMILTNVRSGAKLLKGSTGIKSGKYSICVGISNDDNYCVVARQGIEEDSISMSKGVKELIESLRLSLDI